MAAWKYIHPVDENTVVDISGTTWKFCQKCVCSVTDKSGFQNLFHTTSEHRDRAIETYPPQYQSDDLTTPESNFAQSSDPP